MAASRRLSRCALLASLLALISCHKSHDDNTPPVIPQPPLPQKVAFTVELPQSTAGLAVTVARGESTVDISVPTVNIGGTIDTTSGDVTVRQGPQASSALVVAAPGVFSEVQVQIGEPIVLSGSTDYPTAGRLSVTYETHTVLIAMGATTVTLDLDGGQQTAVLGWAQFDAIDVFGNGPELQRLGAFAFSSLELVVEQGSRCIDGLRLIADCENELQALGPDMPVVIAGDLFPPTQQAGVFEFAWHDTGEPLSAGQVGPGDSFTSTFLDFWRDDPDDDVDMRLDGKIDYFGYGEIDEPFWLGFTEVLFTGFTIVEIEETAPGVFVEDLTTIVSGSLTVQLAEG